MVTIPIESNVSNKAFPLYIVEGGALSVTTRRSSRPFKVIVYSIPKAGTYFLARLLEDLGYINTDLHLSLHATSDYRGKTVQQKRDLHHELLVDISAEQIAKLILPGQFVVGHLPYVPEIRAAFSEFKQLFIYREARDCLVSFLRFLESRKDPGIAAWHKIDDPREKLVLHLEHSSRDIFYYGEVMREWLDDENVLPVCFETLSGDQGPEQQLRELRKILDYLELSGFDGIESLLGKVIGSETLTWSGKRSRFLDYWSPKAERIFLEKGGREINLAYGYLDEDDMTKRLTPIGSEFILEAEREVAIHSPDHCSPHGTKADNSRNPLFNRKLYRLFDTQKLSILDLGCSGGGFVMNCLEDGHIALGLEGSDYSKRHGRAEWVTIPQNLFTCDITGDFKVRSASDRSEIYQFDVITAWEVIEHISADDLPKVCANVICHLKPGGLWIMSVSPNPEVIQGAMLHQTVQPRDWWESFFEAAGFIHHPELVEYFGEDWVRGPLQNAPGSFHLVLSYGETSPSVPAGSSFDAKTVLEAGIQFMNQPPYLEYALHLLESARQVLPDTSEINYYLAEAHLRCGHFAEAEQYARQQLSTESEHSSAQRILDELDGICQDYANVQKYVPDEYWGHVFRGILLRERSHLQAAQQDLEYAVSLKLEAPEAQFHLAQTRILIDEKNKMNDTQLDKRDVQVYLEAAEQYFLAQDLNNARTSLLNALELEPENPQIRIAYGNILLQLNLTSEARSEFELVAEACPEFVPGLLNLAAVQYMSGDVEQCLDSLGRVLVLEPQNEEAANFLGRVQAENVAQGGASQTGELAWDADPNGIDYQFMLEKMGANDGCCECAPAEIETSASSVEVVRKAPVKYCSSFWTESVLSMDGNLTFCCRNPTVIGNYIEEGLEKAWNSDIAQEMRRKAARGEFPDEHCQNCYQVGDTYPLGRPLSTPLQRYCDELEQSLGRTFPELRNLASIFHKTELDAQSVIALSAYLCDLEAARQDPLVLQSVSLQELVEKLQLLYQVVHSFLSGDETLPVIAPAREVNLISICNARCIHCPGRHLGQLAKGLQVSEGVWLKHISPEAHAAALSLPNHIFEFWCNGTEYLIYPRWKEVYQSLSKNRIVLAVSTNSIALSEDAVRTLVDGRSVAHFNVSIDGATKEMVESIRVNVKYERLVKNIKYLIHYANEQKFSFTLNFTFTIMKRNYKEIPQFVDFVKELFEGEERIPGTILYTFLLPEGNDSYFEFLATEHHALINPDELKNLLLAAHQKVDEYGFKAYVTYNSSMQDFIQAGFPFPPLPPQVKIEDPVQKILAAHPQQIYGKNIPWEMPVQLAIRDFLKPGDIAFDIGANVGGVTLAMSRIVGSEGQVYAFEANPDILPVLRRDLTANEVTNVAIVPRAMWNRSNEFLTFYCDERDYAQGSGLLTPVAGRETIVPTCTVDDFCAEHNLNPKVIKIDVEGAEYQVLRGAEKMILQTGPAIIFEYWPRDDSDPIDYLYTLGYACYDTNLYCKVDRQFYVNHAGEYGVANVLALPPGLQSFYDYAQIDLVSECPNPLGGLRSEAIELASPGRYAVYLELDGGENLDLGLAVRNNSETFFYIRGPLSACRAFGRAGMIFENDAPTHIWVEVEPYSDSGSQVKLLGIKVGQVSVSHANPDEGFVFGKKPVQYVREAERWVQENNLDLACEALREAIALEPDNAQLYIALGNLLLKQNDHKGARQEFAKATVFAPDLSTAHLSYAVALYLNGNFLAARASAQTAQQLSPGDLDSLKFLGRISLESGQMEDAIENYQHCLDLNLGDVEVLIGISIAHLRLGNILTAEKYTQTACQQDPDADGLAALVNEIQFEKNKALENGLATTRLLRSGLLKRCPFIVIDAGSRNGADPVWERFGSEIEIIGFEPDPHECEQLNRTAKGSARKEKHYPIALSNAKAPHKLYITRGPAASSFLKPNEKYVSRFPQADLGEVVDAINLDTTDLDSFVVEYQIPYADFLKLDVEGAELDVLKGAEKLLHSSILGISLEVFFQPYRIGQPGFGEIDVYLREAGFQLFDLAPERWVRKTLAGKDQATWYGSGQIMFAQALYLRDLVAGMKECPEDFSSKDDTRILKLASLAERFGLPDYSLELLQTAQEVGAIRSI